MSNYGSVLGYALCVSRVILTEKVNLFQLGDLFVFKMLTTSTTVLGKSQFFRCIGLVAFCDVVEVTTFGAFQA